MSPRLPAGRSAPTRRSDVPIERTPVDEMVEIEFRRTEEDIQQQHQDDSDLVPEPPVTTFSGGLPTSAAASRQPIQLGAQTALDAVLPIPYGPDRLPGYLFAYKETDAYVYCLWVICHGEQDSAPSEFELGGRAISEFTGSGLGSFVASSDTAVGSASQAQTTILGAIYTGTDVSTTRLPGYCYVALKLRRNCTGAMPGSLTLTAKVPGKKVTDFRDSSEGGSKNPIVIANDIMTDRLRFPGFNNIGATLTRWTAADYEWIADRCDEAMSDGTARFEFNGTITTRDGAAALREVLGHCFCNWFMEGSLVRLWADLLPPEVPGSWTASASTTLTDSGSGDASDVSAGDGIIFEDGSFARVVSVDSVSSPNTIAVDRSVTISAESIYRTCGVHIHKSEGERGWLSGPDVRDEPDSSIPDIVVVSYREAESLGGTSKPAADPDGCRYGVSSVIRVEVEYSGVRSASNAVRVGHQIRRTAKLCPFSWTGIAGADAAGLVPGDIITFDSNVLSEQLAIVINVQVRPNNSYGLVIREYDVGVYSDDVADDDTLPDPTSAPPAPDEPTSISEAFEFPAALGDYTVLDDPDDLTAAGANFAATNGSLSTPGAYTRLTPTGGSICYATSPNIAFVEEPDRSTIIFMYRLAPTATYDASQTPSLNLVGNHKTLGDVTLKTIPLTPDDSGDVQWHVIAVTVDHTWSDYNYTNVVLQVGNSATFFLDFRQVYVMPETTNPHAIVKERFRWTEAGGASNTVDRYEVRYDDENGTPVVLGSVPQGNNSIDVVVAGGASVENSDVKKHLRLYVVGVTGAEVELTPSTQTVIGKASGADFKSFRDVDETTAEAGKIGVIDTDGKTLKFDTKSSLDLASAADLSSHESEQHPNWDGDYDSAASYALLDSIGNATVATYRVCLFGGHFNEARVYMQELVFSCKTGGSGSPSVRYSHVGPTVSLGAGVQIYWNSSTSKYDIYIAQAAAYGIPVAQAIKIEGAKGAAEVLEAGAFSGTTPSGTKVFDSTDHSNYPPTLLVDPADDPVIVKRTSSAAAPSTTELPNDGDVGRHKNTLSGSVFLATNDGGSTIKSVELT